MPADTLKMLTYFNVCLKNLFVANLHKLSFNMIGTDFFSVLSFYYGSDKKYLSKGRLYLLPSKILITFFI